MSGRFVCLLVILGLWSALPRCLGGRAAEDGDDDHESKDANRLVKELFGLRNTWSNNPTFSGARAATVMDCLTSGKSPIPSQGNFSFRDYINDLSRAQALVQDRSLFEFAKRRLQGLDLSERNGQWEASEQTDAQPGLLPNDVHSSPKVDNHVHHSGAMTQAHLLKFVSSVLGQEHHRDAIRAFLTQQIQSKKAPPDAIELFEGIAKRAQDKSLTLSLMDVFAGDRTYARFDVFNSKFSPFAMDFFRTVFLKPTTEIEVNFTLRNGERELRKVRYMADLTHDVCYRLPSDYFAEWRISIYGFSDSEYADLLEFFKYQDIRGDFSWYGIGDGPLPTGGQPGSDYVTVAKRCEQQISWMLQVPRIFHAKPLWGQNFSAYLTNLWKPLLTKDASAMELISHVSGFDSVDDETQDSGEILGTAPRDLVSQDGMAVPPFSYYMYFMAMGIAGVNQVAGTNLTFRPHCGEGGSPKHLIVCFLLAGGISHGTQLRISPVMQYMYFLAQLPISMSISSNHYLVLKSMDSPFGALFLRGLFISLSTDDPMIFFDVEDERGCLMSDYALAEKLFDHLAWPDLAEIARNSLLMSGLGAKRVAKLRGVNEFQAFDRWACDSERTGVPHSRVAARRSAWCGEVEFLGLDVPACT